mgnify:CR=1 FL=1
MYNLFSKVNFIQTNERNYKILFNKKNINKRFDNESFKLLTSKNKSDSSKLITNIKNNSLRKNWRPFHSSKKYFSQPIPFISKYN